MATNRLLRITQINAVYFDKEIFNVLKHHVQECFKYLPPGLISQLGPEIDFLLRLAILRYSILENGSSFGQQLLSIKYEELNRRDKACFVLAGVFDYLKDKFQNVSVLSSLSSVGKFLQFWNISYFLRNGEKPRLIERALNLKQVYAKENAHRHYEDKYMSRELLWNGFIEVLVYMLPLINYHKITRVLRHLNPLHVKPNVRNLDAQERRLSLESRCPHCGEYPVHPSHMGCAHVFCYYCLKGNQSADSKYECPVCEYCSDNVMCEMVYC